MSYNDRSIRPGFAEPMFKRFSEILLARFKISIGTERCEIAPAQPASINTDGFWLGMVLVEGGGCRIIIKCFFSTHSVKPMLASYMGLPIEKISLSHVKDYIGELCNLSGGGIMKYLGDQGSTCGISLPIIIRGFDDIFYDTYATSLVVLEEAWTLKSGSESVKCAITVEVIDSHTAGALDFSRPDDIGGEASFL